MCDMKGWTIFLKIILLHKISLCILSQILNWVQFCYVPAQVQIKLHSSLIFCYLLLLKNWEWKRLELKTSFCFPPCESPSGLTALSDLHTRSSCSSGSSVCAAVSEMSSYSGQESNWWGETLRWKSVRFYNKRKTVSLNWSLVKKDFCKKWGWKMCDGEDTSVVSMKKDWTNQVICELSLWTPKQQMMTLW